tara:strand:- start:60 stop:269 length:210 start_codon:yes stop_codon:yes gene_type:complete
MSTREPKSAFKQMKIPQELFNIPRAYQQKQIKMHWACCYNPTINITHQLNIETQGLKSEKENDAASIVD